MSTIFRLDASIRQQGSVTRTLADRLETALSSGGVAPAIIRRDVGLTPVPATAWAGAVFAPYVPADERAPHQVEGMKLAADFADELLPADGYIFAAPLYNFGVSQHFKAWVDLVLTDPRFAPGTPSPIAGRPAQLIVARGGGYGPGTPRHGWDHATAWYRRVLEDMWSLEVQVIECELTLADVTPAMETLRPLAAQNLEQALALADNNGLRFAERLAARPLVA